jgi:hypothetical protein
MIIAKYILFALFLAIIVNYILIIKLKKPFILSIVMSLTIIPHKTIEMLTYNSIYPPIENMNFYLKFNHIAYMYFSLLLFDIIFGILYIVLKKIIKNKKNHHSNFIFYI